MARITRSKTKPSESRKYQVSSSPIEAVVESLDQHPITQEPKRRKINSNRYATSTLSTFAMKEQLRSALHKVRPSYMAKPKKMNDNESNYVKRCEERLTLNILKIDPGFLKQIQELKKFQIFKDMSKVDIRTVKLLQSDLGEMNETDRKILKLLSSNEQDLNNRKFCELYGIDLGPDPL